MGKHAAARPTSSGQRKTLLGALALVVATLLLLANQGSLAFWTDKATVTSGNISAGTLDLTVDGDQGTPSYAKSTLTLTSMVPGESVVSTLSVANVGDASFRWVPTVTTGGTLGPALQVDLHVGGATAGQATTYPRTQTCTGTKITSGTTATQLNKGAAAQVLCVQVSLPAATGDGFQGATTGSVTVALAATQVIP